MGRKKERFFDGVRLVDHLYRDAQSRNGYWRYKRPDQTYRVFRAKTVHEANLIADDANRRRHLSQLDRMSMAYAVERYIDHAERSRPGVRAKESWKNKVYAMRKFARDEFPNRTVTQRELWGWWHTLTHSQQILRQAEFRKLFNFLIQERLVLLERNPFTLMDDQPRLYLSEKPDSQRERLAAPDFWKVYASAPEGVQVAMGLSLLTTMRRGDVVMLTRQSVQDGYLRRIISKAEQKRGVIKAARLQWKLNDHPELADLIERGIKLGEKHQGCPYLVSIQYRNKRKSREKTHHYQVMPDRLTREFDKARNAAGVGGEHPPTFHEVRSLGSALLAKQGEEITDIMELMAHSDEEMTKLYQSGHPLPWQTVDIRIRDVEGEW